jgi:hypothetical protein
MHSQKKPVIGIMGKGRVGKDRGADWLTANYGLNYYGSTSYLISEEIARRDGISFKEAHNIRHIERDRWRRVGDEMRLEDPAALAREIIRRGSNLLVGIRSYGEMEAIRREKMCDIVLWIDKPDVDEDPTLEFGPEMADIVIYNWWGLDEYYAKLNVWADTCNLLTPKVIK